MPQQLTTSPPENAITALPPGTLVYVRDRFLGDWSSGFAVHEVLSRGYRLRRISDGQVFDEVFALEDVREERRKRTTLWGDGFTHLDRRRRG
jgi:hypothetical protein